MGIFIYNNSNGEKNSRSDANCDQPPSNWTKSSFVISEKYCFSKKNKMVDYTTNKNKKDHLLEVKVESKDVKSKRKHITRSASASHKCFDYFIVSVSLSFILGLFLGILIVICTNKPVIINRTVNITERLSDVHTRNLNSIRESDLDNTNDDNFPKVAFQTREEELDKHVKYHKHDNYPKGLTENMKNILKDNKNVHLKHTIQSVIKSVKLNNSLSLDTVIFNNIYWGPQVENFLPKGYDENSQRIWEKYIDQAEIVKMEVGCGRMYNRLVTFRDGLQACVRYRQNTDQIQGEIFSYYVGRLLKLNNLAPSVVKVVDPKNKLWNSVINDIVSSQWNTNRAVVLTQYIPSLESASIPNIFKPASRHLNKYDIYQISSRENGTMIENNLLVDKIKTKKTKFNVTIENFEYLNMKLSEKTLKEFKELAQWSDLIIFDYLTANLDRIVNNLFNYQWNINIMDGPAHNLAKKIDNDLLVFLDNESGLLHGYRLLKKYNMYHSLMLDNLCVFRKTTIDNLKDLYNNNDVGSKISEMYHKKNDAIVRDILPSLPEKNVKILHERIGKILSQVDKCKDLFGLR